MVQAAHHHRPTLKQVRPRLALQTSDAGLNVLQQNKSFKSKYATKGSLKEAAKGASRFPFFWDPKVQLSPCDVL